MKWRWQPVIFGEGESSYVAMVEVYSEPGKPEGPLKSWTAESVEPHGDDQAEYVRVLAAMLNEAMAWKAVPLADLKVGYVFEQIAERRSKAEIFGHT